MDPVFIVTISTKGKPEIVRYVVSEAEAQSTVRNRADRIADRLRKEEENNVYLSQDKQMIKVLLQGVGSLWNGFLHEHTSLSYTAVSHMESPSSENEECCFVEAETEVQDNDSNFAVST